MVLCLLLQACALVLQFSTALTPQSSTFDLALNVICTEHGAKSLPADGEHDDEHSGCIWCPLCCNSGAGNLAILSRPSIVAILAPARALVFDIDRDTNIIGFLAHPRSRGPP